MLNRATLLRSTTVAAGGLLLAAAAQAQTLGPLKVASSGTPFSKCTADQAGSQPGRYFNASAVEPWIAADPRNAGHLLVGVQQDRWSTGGSRGLKAIVTNNGGNNFTPSLPGGVSACTGGRLPRSTDPWTAFDLNGTAYFFSLAFANNPSTFINGESALYVSSSADGVNWQAPVTVIDDTDPLAFNDKNAITADPTQPGHVYAVWDRLYGPPYLFKVGSDENGSGNGNAAATQALIGTDAARARIHDAKVAAATQQPNPNDYFGPTYYARSVDGGRTFERAVPIYDPGRGQQTIGNEVVVAPDGTLYDFFTHVHTDGTTSIEYIRSDDHGFSWTTRPIVAVTSAYFGNGSAVTPDSAQLIRQADIIFSVTVDGSSGLLGIAFEYKGTQPGALTQIYYTQSTDAKNWSTPIRINRTPQDKQHPLRGQAFNMAVAAAGSNTLVATYYDFRNDTGANGQELADMWVTFCTYASPADCTKSANWGREQRMTNTSFNILSAPVSAGRGFFLGDYFGLIAQGNTVYSAFTVTNRNKGQTDLETRQIRITPTLARAQ